MRGDILGIERRRRWSDQDKLLIVSSVGIDGATVTQVAQRNDVTRQQIYAWRHELKKKGLWSPEEGAIFLPIGVPAIECAPAASVPAASVSVELGLVKGRTLRFDSVMDEAALMRLIRAVEAA
jgi:transposase